MKQLVIILFFLPVLAGAQRTVTLDSSAVINEADIFYFVRTIRYDNGDEDVSKVVLGDTMTTYNRTLDATRQSVNTLVNDLRIVSQYPGKITEAIRFADAVSVATGLNISDTLQVEGQADFLDNDWTITGPDGATLPITFTLNNNGKIRYAIGEGTRQTANVIGDLLRMRNFPTSKERTDFIRMPNGNYIDVLRRYKIQKQ